LETLAAAAVRREYDERFRMGEISEEVPADYVAGTLMLLQESGDRQTVVAVGEAWLAQHKRHKSAKDVALATVLAHIDVAKGILDARGSVESAHATLELAAKLLKSYRAGTAELLSQIESAARDLRPQLTLDLLSSENAPARARGMAFLPAALEAVTNNATVGSIIFETEAAAAGSTSPSSPSRRRSQFTRPQYLERLREVLTADQQIALYNQVGNLYASSPGEICNLAIAHIAAGVASAKPSIIHRATEMLADAEQIAATEEEEEQQQRQTVSEGSSPLSMVRTRRILDEKHRRAVAACAAWLLLGNSAAAGDALGLRDGRIKCDRQVMHFIRSNSPEPDSLLPGVCALVQRWVSDVALASFRTEGTETLAGQFILDDWFENPKVLKELDGVEGNVTGGFLAVVTAPLKALARIFLAPKADTKKTDTVAPPAVESSAKEEEEYIPTPAPVVASPVSTTVIKKEEEREQEKERIPVSATASTPVPVTSPSAPGPAAVLTPEPTLEEALAAFEDDREAFLQAAELEAAEFEEDKIIEEEEFLAQPVALESIKPLYGEDDWMRKAYETRNIRWNRVAGAAAVIAMTSVFAARSYLVSFFSTATPTPTHFSPPIAAVAAASNPAGTKPLSRNEATSLVSKWQKTKAAALGSSHSLSGLSSVLFGDLLKQWHDRAAALQAKGWHYTHTLHSSKIEDVVEGPVPGTAIITSAFKEGVTVHKGSEDVDGGSDNQQQTFISEYKVVYQTIKQGDNWMLVSAVVQQTP
jgi:hypothetical protein